MLSVRNLRKDFSTTRAVDDVSFEVHRGEIFGLIGPNGAGKTTSIRIILNILEADGGEVLYDGQRFTDDVRNVMGYLPEERGLYKKSRLMDAMLYFGELRGMKRAKARTEAQRWLTRLDLTTSANRRIQELSKGNQQKAQFIAAVIHEPWLVVLDEPFSGLDPVNQILFKDILLELKEAQKAVIFSTHQMDQAEKLSDALCLINRGRAVLDGTVRDIKKRYGRNTLHLEFEGEGAFMENLPGVQRAILFGNAAELELAPDVQLPNLLSALNAKVELRKFELLEPSLQSIFLRTVGDGRAPGGSVQEAAA
jgi:ABC-2 type transport system ATP-binding protein